MTEREQEILDRFEWPCDLRIAHGGHDDCPGVSAHPLTMIGGATA